MIKSKIKSSSKLKKIYKKKKKTLQSGGMEKDYNKPKPKYNRTKTISNKQQNTSISMQNKLRLLTKEQILQLLMQKLKK